LRIECGTPFFSVAMATRLTYSLVGDSSLYTKKRNGDKHLGLGKHGFF
jgi:hypothetical protein